MLVQAHPDLTRVRKIRHQLSRGTMESTHHKKLEYLLLWMLVPRLALRC